VLTPEQKQAHAALDEAVQEVLRHQGAEGGGPLPTLVDWLVVVEGVTFEDNGDNTEWHNIILRGGAGRRSVALGLLDIAAELLEPTED
jgi:hypothetical protein